MQYGLLVPTPPARGRTGMRAASLQCAALLLSRTVAFLPCIVITGVPLALWALGLVR